ncbi:hypothetical protein [Anaerovibrio sp.]|uniref:hypothetical protein n=1 Tax=Anaerovibrio sp. TaxID=1872532 RepID=UPI0025C366D2|nr:hypothetical protein [Anaerovibrio sp.]MBR2142827.1 hypothetical protein [Anaerovibrio sp.]
MIPEKFMQIGAAIMQNPEMLQKLSEAKSPQEAYEIVKGLLDGMTMEEFLATAATLAPLIPADITDEQLAAMPAGNIIKAFKGWVKDLPPVK